MISWFKTRNFQRPKDKFKLVLRPKYTYTEYCTILDNCFGIFKFMILKSNVLVSLYIDLFQNFMITFWC